MSKAASKLIVFERTSHWTARLEREWQGRYSHQIRWRPYSLELVEELPDHDVALLVLATDNASLDLIRELRDRSVHTDLICLIDEDHSEWEVVARELGVIAILPQISPQSEIIGLIETVVSERKS